MDSALVNMSPILITSTEKLLKNNNQIKIGYLPSESTEQAPVERLN